MAEIQPAPLADSKKPFELPIGQPSGARGSDLHIRPDAQTNVLHLVRGDTNQTSIRDLGPVVQGVVPVDEEGNVARVSEGALHVKDVADHFPQYKYTAAGTDAFVTLFTVTHDCSHVVASTKTNPICVAILLPQTSQSIPLFTVMAANTAVVTGLPIPKGSEVRIINGTAASNAAEVTVSVW